MLFDSDINVYEERNISLQTENVFNIRGHKQKVLTKKEKEKMEKEMKDRIKIKKIQQKRAKNNVIDMPAPEKINFVSGVVNTNNDQLFIAESKEETDLDLKDNLFPDDDSGGEDFEQYNERIK